MGNVAEVTEMNKRVAKHWSGPPRGESPKHAVVLVSSFLQKQLIGDADYLSFI